jgi:hypothetical protein
MTTLERLDSLPAILESLRLHYSAESVWMLKAEERFPYARQALEMMTVAEEDNLAVNTIDTRDARFIELLDLCKPDDSDFYKQFEIAIRENNTRMVEFFLIDGRVNPNNCIKEIGKIHFSGPIPKVEDCNYLWLAVACARRDIVALLLKDGRSDPSRGNSNCILQAATIPWYRLENHDSIEILRMLLMDGRADPLIRNYHGPISAAYYNELDKLGLFDTVERID